jgi:hypothetical protein
MTTMTAARVEDGAAGETDRDRAVVEPMDESHLKALAATLDGGPRPATRPRLLALLRGQLSAVRQQVAELQLLQGQLEQVLHRLLTSARADDGQGCRCLEIESVPVRRARE